MHPCEETHYTVSVSATPFRQCSNKNLGLTRLCNLESAGDIDPPIWGASVLRQYTKGGEVSDTNSIPDYITENVQTNERSYIAASEVNSSVCNHPAKMCINASCFSSIQPYSLHPTTQQRHMMPTKRT